ncbi:MAG: DUF3526 domain-containing protein [Bryobacteraceae bacterium]|nr:DUF3526 domain-containing protein [Bryobacteraceae bacterium]
MRSIRTVTFHDLKVAWREGMVPSLVVLITLVSFYAAVSGRVSAAREVAAQQRFRSSEEANLSHHKSVAERVLKEIAEGRLPDKSPPDYGPLHAWYVKNFAILSSVLPPAPLSALSNGSMALQPQAHAISLYSNLFTFKTPEATESPFKLLIGQFDLALVVASLLPLAVIAATFSMTAAEREAGILGLLLSNPISYLQLSLGKLLSRSLIVLCLALIVFVAAVVGVAGVGSLDETFGRLWLWAPAIFLYGVFWLLTGWAVDAFSKNASWNALVLSTIWLSTTIVMPSGLRTFAAAIFPPAPRVEFVETLRNASGLSTTSPDQLREHFLRKYPQFRRSTRYPRIGNSQVLAAARSEETAEAFAALSDRYEGQQRRQRELIRKFGWIAPPLLLESALNTASGSSYERHDHYLAQVKDYHKQWQAFFWPRIFEESVVRPEDYDRMPRFQYREESARQVFLRSLEPLLGLTVWCLAAFGFAYLAHLRAPHQN